MLLHRLPYDDWFDDELPDLAPSSVEPSEVSDIPEGGGTTRKDQLKDVTMHEKAYKIATSKYNPFSIGGSENIHDFDRKD
tara:strand:- start:209 stop:448 length:240 start_codon:yes stop_codon:yes gene_type:complete